MEDAPPSLRSLRRGAAQIAVAAFAATTFAACTAQPRVVGGGSGPVLSAPVKVAPGSVSADFTVVGDASQILRESARDSLEAAGMTCPGSTSGCATVDLSARIGQPASSFQGVRPPVRVVELVARYRPVTGTASRVSYQRTVAVDGNLTTAQ